MTGSINPVWHIRRAHQVDDLIEHRAVFAAHGGQFCCLAPISLTEETKRGDTSLCGFYRCPPVDGLVDLTDTHNTGFFLIDENTHDPHGISLDG